jgi:hypothetical protein
MLLPAPGRAVGKPRFEMLRKTARDRRFAVSGVSMESMRTAIDTYGVSPSVKRMNSCVPSESTSKPAGSQKIFTMLFLLACAIGHDELLRSINGVAASP